MKRQPAGLWAPSVSAAARTILVAAALALVGGSAVGCATAKKNTSGSLVSATTGSVVYGTFVPQAEARLSPSAPLSRLLAVGDGVYAYTATNSVYGMSQGLDIRFIKQVIPPLEYLRPLVQVGDELIFPSAKGLLVLSKEGAPIRTVTLQHPLSSDLHVDQRGLLLAGVAAPTGGRVAVIDPQRDRRASVQETLLRGNVLSAPVALQGIVFAATDQGKVFAVGSQNSAAWPITGQSFQTDRPIQADLVIDDYALYVAATDYKLYALDRSNGRIKWRYEAETALKEAPVVTKDRVYQVVPDVGVVAINKLEGKLYREPLWTAKGVTRVLSVDDKYVYAVEGTRRLVALDLADGKERFAADGRFDLATAAGDALFVAGSDGRVLKLKRGPYTGEQAAK